MKKLQIAFASLLFVAGATATPALADETSDNAIAFIETLSADVLDTIKGDGLTEQQREAKLHELFRRGLDIPGIGRFVLGRFWGDATPEQIGEYQTLFTAYLLGTTTRLIRREEVQSFAVTAAGPAEGGDVLVQTRLQLAEGKPLQWAWRVRKVGGELRIVDLLKDGVSMATTYRSEFGSVAASRGLDGLLKALRSRAAQARAAVGAQAAPFMAAA